MPQRQSSSIGLLLLSGLLGFDAEAQDTLCRGPLGREVIRTNLDVVGSCRLVGTEVRGNVTLFEGGSLTARDARIAGNLEGRRADFVDLDDTVVTGNLRLDELVGDRSTLQRTRLRGNAALRENRSRLELSNNDFGGNVEVVRNRGGVLMSGNAIDGSLRCSGNDPAPVGIGNRVDGDTRGQCQNLRPAPAETPPPATPPPSASQPPPATTPPPASSSPPSASPPAATPAAQVTPPATGAPPATVATPPSAASPPAPEPTPSTPASAEPLDDGGAGALGWWAALLVPMLAWRRRSRGA
jgi:hypothetical protein